MRRLQGHGALCHRSREWISLRLDGELSELAEKMLESHLARCAACRTFESDVGIAIGLVAFLYVPSSNTLASRSPSIVAPSGNQDIEQFRLFRAAALKPVVRPPRQVRGPQKT